MEKLTQKVEVPSEQKALQWRYNCRNCNNTIDENKYEENKKCSICKHRYDVPIKIENL